MTEIAQWILANGEKVGGYIILISVTVAFVTGRLWSKNAVDGLRADFEKREAKVIADCEYHRQAHERLLGELERALALGRVLAIGKPS